MAGTPQQMPTQQVATGGVTPTGMSGPLGITPAPSPNTAIVPVLGGPPPTGMSPIAKRPRDVGTFASMDTGGATRVMSVEDLTGGFINLSRLQERDAAFSQEIAKVVHENAVLLNAAISRVNAVEAATTLTGQQLEALRTETVGQAFINTSKIGSKNLPSARSWIRWP